jgi:hypothetical protein
MQVAVVSSGEHRPTSLIENLVCQATTASDGRGSSTIPESTFTNLPNHLNYAPPSTDVTSSTFGKITSVPTAENAGNRTGQVALRIEF